MGRKLPGCPTSRIIESELAEESKCPTATDVCCVMPLFGHATDAATERSLSRISAAVKPSKSLPSSELAYYKLSEPDAGIWWLNLSPWLRNRKSVP